MAASLTVSPPRPSTSTRLPPSLAPPLLAAHRAHAPLPVASTLRLAVPLDRHALVIDSVRHHGRTVRYVAAVVPQILHACSHDTSLVGPSAATAPWRLVLLSPPFTAIDTLLTLLPAVSGKQMDPGLSVNNPFRRGFPSPSFPTQPSNAPLPSRNPFIDQPSNLGVSNVQQFGTSPGTVPGRRVAPPPPVANMVRLYYLHSISFFSSN